MKKIRFENILRILAIVLICALTASIVALVILFSVGAKPSLIRHKEKQENTDGEKKTSAILLKTPDYGEFYLNDIVFLGDKSIESLKDPSLLKYAESRDRVLLGEDGDLPLDTKLASASVILPSDQSILSISEAMKRLLPEHLIITVGLSNGAQYCSRETFILYYTALIDCIKEASPNTKIILQSILPVSSSFESDTLNIAKDKIETANGWIMTIANESNVAFLNTFEALSNSNGDLKQEFDSGDGFTLNQEGLSAMLYYIRTHGYK